MTICRLRILGAPRTKKTHNVLATAGHRHIVLPSKAWGRWTKSAEIAIDVGKHAVCWVPFVETEAWEADVNCRALFYRDALRGDAVGYYQGLADLLEQRGVLLDDRQIVSWDGSRLLVDRAHPRVEVVLEEVA